MSSYDPPEENEDDSSHDPGVKGREITEQREFSGLLTDLGRSDYVLIGILLSIPASILTALLITMLFPDYQETAGEIVRWVGQRIADLLLLYLVVFEVGELSSAGQLKNRF